MMTLPSKKPSMNRFSFCTHPAICIPVCMEDGDESPLPLDRLKSTRYIVDRAIVADGYQR